MRGTQTGRGIEQSLPLAVVKEDNGKFAERTIREYPGREKLTYSTVRIGSWLTTGQGHLVKKMCRTSDTLTGCTSAKGWNASLF
jgi:hypothetical protein